MVSSRHPYCLVLCAAMAIIVGAGRPPQAASQNIDLDGKTTNASESNDSLTVVSSFPTQIKNKITNKAIGDAFTFNWASAGPGGFASSLPAGTSTGVGAAWTWQTTQTVLSFTGSLCTNDLCFSKTAGPDSVTTRGPFGAPGRSLSSSGVTVSNASLTSSLITFFSPPTVLATVTSLVQPLGGGAFTYTTRIENKTNSTINVDIAAGPPGCCPDIHQKNCSGTCVYYLTDPANCGTCGHACASGEECASGTCVVDCPGNQRNCGGTCVDLESDPDNCGSCGNVCGSDTVCTGGACVPCHPPTGTACAGRCVNIHTDSENCGGCGINCNFQCPSTGHGTCSQGQSCLCSPGGIALFPDPDEAPLCESPSLTQTIPPGSTFQACRTGAVLAKEISSSFKVCGASIPDGPTTCGTGEPASQGPFNILVPDLTTPPANVILTPGHLEITDPSGDGVPQPGETIKAKLSLLNAGPITLTGVTAVLSSPPVDLTQDGTTNAVALGIPVASSSYPNIAGSPITGGTDCSSPPIPPIPSVNTTAFSISIPSNYPADVAPPLKLAVSGLASGTPFQMDVPIVLGIGSACSLSNIDGRFDGVNGLLNPMSRLVKAGDQVVYAGPFQQGKTRPLKMQVLCQGVSLTDQQTLPPQIIGLSRNGVPLDITTLNLNADPPNPNAPLFRYGSGWTYNLSTKFLTKATYVMTIRLGGDQDYVTGFILN